MVCGDYDKCQCYKGCSQDYICWRDENGNVCTSTKLDNISYMERYEGETSAECLSRYRKKKIAKILELFNT